MMQWLDDNRYRWILPMWGLFLLLFVLPACKMTVSLEFPAGGIRPAATTRPDLSAQPLAPTPTLPAQVSTHTTVVLDGLIGPVGLAMLSDGTLLIAEEGTGDDDASAGVSILTPGGQSGRLIAGLPSSRNAGDLAGAHLVSVAPDGRTIYVGSFGTGYLWEYQVQLPLQLPEQPLLPEQLGQTMLPLNNVRLVNPFDMTYAADGRPIVSDGSGNGVATLNPDGTTRFIHRFDMLANPQRPSDPIEAVPTGIERIDDEYYVTLFGGCPYPAHSGQLVAIDEHRNQRTVVDALNLPIDVARGADGTIWVLEFARFTPGASCFDGSGYQPHSGQLSRLSNDGRLQTVLDNLDFPGALLPMPDGSLYYSEVFGGRVLHVLFEDEDDGVAVANEVTESVPTLAAPMSTTTPMTTTVAGPAGLYFTDVAEQVGLTFQHGAFRTAISMDPVAAMGAGLCWIDFDNDGWLDLYLVNSHAVEEVSYWEANGGLPRNALYRNVEGHFIDVGSAAGVDVAVRGNGCVAADLNLDGRQDLLVTADGPDLLFWNQGDGTFVEGGVAAGVAAAEWNSAAVVGDLNNDGLPDLFVAAYIDLNKMIPKPSGAFPQDFYGLPDRLYINRGIDPTSGYATFREVTSEVGLTREERGLGAMLTDVDQDGDLDLYIANDGHPNRLYANVPWPGGVLADPVGVGFRFEDVTAVADVGDSGSGMGVAGGDYDGDMRVDLLITNWDRELNALYANQTVAADTLDFQYETFRIGMSGFGANQTGWGVQMADFDHDSDDDLLIVNGHVPITDFAVDAESVRFYRNRQQELLVTGSTLAGPPRRFVDESDVVGLSAVGPLMARGSASADFDNDGDLDVAVNTVGRHVVLLA
ncbi:MAG: ScyD/ScyE family protein, partial [Caldilineaceae bacterium]|nr:ScyD/ScyE family protein [Caldilineaceae bacterium]